LFPTQIEELILGVDGLSAQFQCVLDRPDRLDQLTVRVEARPDLAAELRVRAGATLTEQIKNQIGVSVLVEVLEPDSIERSVGKARRLLDHRPSS